MNEYLNCRNSCNAFVSGSCCSNSECRYWVEYPEDLNCSLISVDKHGPMTLEEVAKRIGVSFVRISQIEKKALTKLVAKIEK